MQHNAGKTYYRMLTKMMFENMTCGQIKFCTLDITGFSLRFINFKFSRFFFITEMLCTIGLWQYGFL